MTKTPLLDALKRHRILCVLRSLAGFAGARMRETHLQEVASSMTLTTLLSLVPLIAVSLAVFAAFPSFAETRRSLEVALLNSFLPMQYSEEILRYIRLFSEHASGLGAFGIAGLSVTALMMIDKFFVTVSRIFRVRRMRPWTQRAMLYWALLTLGPACIALSMTLTTQALRLAAGVADGGLPGWAIALFQVLLQTVAYGALFKLVPNCRVAIPHALIGGFVVALAGQVVKIGFEYYVTAGTLSSIYGAFVAVPVLLLWLYVSWLLVFAGAAVTATIPQITSGRFADAYMLGNDFLTGVALLRELAAAREAGRPVVSEDELARAADTYPQAAESILSRLSEYEYCAPVMESARRRVAGWALLCDPREKSLRDAVSALLIDPRNGLVQPARESPERPAGPLARWYGDFTGESAFLDRPLSELIGLDPNEASDKVPDKSSD